MKKMIIERSTQNTCTYKVWFQCLEIELIINFDRLILGNTGMLTDIRIRLYFSFSFLSCLWSNPFEISLTLWHFSITSHDESYFFSIQCSDSAKKKQMGGGAGGGFIPQPCIHWENVNIRCWIVHFFQGGGSMTPLFHLLLLISDYHILACMLLLCMRIMLLTILFSFLRRRNALFEVTFVVHVRL